MINTENNWSQRDIKDINIKMDKIKLLTETGKIRNMLSFNTNIRIIQHSYYTCKAVVPSK